MASALRETDFPPRLTAPLAITHATVVPMDDERLLPDHTLVIEGGRIRALAPAAQLDVSGMAVVDAAGGYLMPGLADMHAHFGFIRSADASRDALLFLANGVTQLRNMSGTPFHLAWEQAVRRGELPGPHVFTTTPIVEGIAAQGPPVAPGFVALTDPAQAEPLVQRFAARGYPQLKVYSRLTAEVLRALCRAAQRVGMRVAGHCPEAMTYEEAIAAGVTCFEHLRRIAAGHLRGGRRLPSALLAEPEAARLIAHEVDFDAIRRLAGRLAAEQIWNCPTVVVHQQINQQPAAALVDPVLCYLAPARVKAWEMALGARGSSEAGVAEERLALLRAQAETELRIIGILHEEGAPLLLGTDTTNPFVVPGFSLHRELANLVRAGLSPYAALRSGTSEAARFLDQSGEWGTVAVGARADLLLTRANPLADVGALRDLEAVFVNGYHLTRAELDALLEQQAARLSGPAAPPVAELELPIGPGTIVRQGTLSERQNGAEVGRVHYRHRRMPDGEWLLEEAHASDLQRRSTRLWLTPDFALRAGEYKVESVAGTEEGEITWEEAGRYAVRLVEIDGHQTTTALGERPLPPSERLLATGLVPLLAEQLPDNSQLTALSLDFGGPTLASVAVEASASADGVDNGAAWRVRVEHASGPTEQTYRLSPDGALLAIGEAPTWRGVRELLPIEDQGP